MTEPLGPVRPIILTSHFVLGSTVDYRDGFVGCMRGLTLNGRVMDLKSAADRGLYGKIYTTSVKAKCVQRLKVAYTLFVIMRNCCLEFRQFVV